LNEVFKTSSLEHLFAAKYVISSAPDFKLTKEKQTVQATSTAKLKPNLILPNSLWFLYLQAPSRVKWFDTKPTIIVKSCRMIRKKYQLVAR